MRGRLDFGGFFREVRHAEGTARECVSRCCDKAGAALVKVQDWWSYALRPDVSETCLTLARRN
jgi:hypothetical protein